MTIWQLIDRLPAALPFSKEKIENMLGAALGEPERGGNDVFQFFENSAPIPVGTATIASVDLRLRRSGGHPGFLVLGISENCITLADVRDRYLTLQITDVPRGRSLHDATAYSANEPWGRLSFSFKVSKPECVATVVFDPA